MQNTYVIDFAGGHRGQRIVRAANPAAAELAAVKWNGGRVVATRSLEGDGWMPDADGGASRIVQSAEVGDTGWHIALVAHLVTWEAGADRIVWKVCRMNSAASAVLVRTASEQAARLVANREWARDVAALKPFGQGA